VFRRISENLQMLNIRVRIVAITNLMFSIYYLYISIFSVQNDNDVLIVLRNILAFIGILTGSIYLYFGKRAGKTITQLIGILGIISIVGYGCYGFSFLGQRGYSNIVVMSYTTNYIWNIFIKFAYPIIASFLILNKSNDELGLN
jgi:hypothetical protein